GLPHLFLLAHQDQLHLSDSDPDRDHAARAPGRRREIPPIERALSRTGDGRDRYPVHSGRALGRHRGTRHRLPPQPGNVAAGGGRLYARSAAGRRLMRIEDCFKLLTERLKDEVIVTSAGNCSELWWEFTGETSGVL